jgi:coenzyme A diphosphatase NUDT7
MKVSLSQIKRNISVFHSSLATRLTSIPSEKIPRAAVMIPLFEHAGFPSSSHGPIKYETEDTSHPSEDECWVLLTVRSSHLSSHPGEVCIPGGKREPADATDIDAALRECSEEINLSPSDVEILSVMNPTLSKHHLLVVPVAGFISKKFQPILQQSEVSCAFPVPLRAFLSHDYHSVYEGTWKLDWSTHQYRIHSFQFPKEWLSFAPYKKLIETHPGLNKLKNLPIVWGLTAQILIQLAEVAYNTKAEFEVFPRQSPSYTMLAEAFLDYHLKRDLINLLKKRIVNDGYQSYNASKGSKL